MKRQLRYKIYKIEEGKQKIIVHLGKNPITKHYDRLTRVFKGNGRQADAYARAWIYELEHPEETTATETVGQWLDFWLENDARILLKWEQNTRRRKEQFVKNNIKPQIGEILLAALSVDDILTMYRELGKTLAPRTLRHIHTTLNQSLNHAVKRGKIGANPAQGLTPALDTEDDKDKWVVLDRKQLAAFLEAIKDARDYIIIYAAAYTGARQSELLGLTWDKVLFDQKAIRVVQALHRDKDAKDGFELRPRTKRRSSLRTIQVTERVINLLKELKAKQKAEGYKGNHVFLEPDGKYIDASNLTKRFKKLAKKNDHEGMTFHHLRHTHATILLSEGAYINEVAERLGHADPSITLKLYGHVLPDRPATLAQFFDTLIDEKDGANKKQKPKFKVVFKGRIKWNKGKKKTN